MQNSAQDAINSGPFFKNKIAIPLRERPPRVIIEIDKKETQKAEPKKDASPNLKVLNSSRNSKLLERKVTVVDSTKLLFDLKCNAPSSNCYRRAYNFDYVGNGDSDQMLRVQMAMVTDRLFLEGCNNCCVLYFAPQRSQSTLLLLCNILIPEICKRLESQVMVPLQLHAIRIEICDVRKYDIVNLIAETAKKGKVRNSAIVHNSWELTQWIQNIYPSLWEKGSGHENIEFKFIFLKDRKGTRIRSKLSIMQFFMNKMDTDMSAGFRNFLENCGTQLNTRVRYSILTEYLREFFFGTDNWYIWMIFKVPIKKKTETICEMLTMASAAYAGVQTLSDGATTQYDSFFTDNEVKVPLRNQNLNGSQMRSRSGISMKVSPSNSLTHSASKTLKFEKPTSLSNWYRQLDEKVFNVLLTMETYYIRKYRYQNQFFLIQNLNAEPKKRPGFISTVRNSAKTPIQPESPRLLQFSSNYQKALTELQSVVVEIEQSSFANLLKCLIQTKNNELYEHLNELRKRYGKNVRSKTKTVTL